MNKIDSMPEKDRRTFMKEVAVLGGAAMFAGYAKNAGASPALAAQAASSADWSKRLGLNCTRFEI